MCSQVMSQYRLDNLKCCERASIELWEKFRWIEFLQTIFRQWITRNQTIKSYKSSLIYIFSLYVWGSRENAHVKILRLNVIDIHIRYRRTDRYIFSIYQNSNVLMASFD